jgi:hypothetical protein
VAITKDTVRGSEGMLKESEAAENAIRKLTLDTLKSKGFIVIDGDAPADSASVNEEARYSLADLQGKYDQLYPQVLSKMKDVEKGRFTLGEDVAKIRPPSPVDALIFVRGSGNLETRGKSILRAMATLGAPQLGSMLILSFGVIDARTGEVLYFDKQLMVLVTLGSLEKPEAVFKKPTEKAFRKAPAPASATKSK